MKEFKKEIRGCTHLNRFVDSFCCDTCHEDHEDYHYDLSEFESSRYLWLVCCKNKEVIEKLATRKR